MKLFHNFSIEEKLKNSSLDSLKKISISKQRTSKKSSFIYLDRVNFMKNKQFSSSFYIFEI